MTLACGFARCHRMSKNQFATIVTLTAASIAFVIRFYEHDPSEDAYNKEVVVARSVDPVTGFKTLVVATDLPQGKGLVVVIIPVTGQLDVKALARQ